MTAHLLLSTISDLFEDDGAWWTLNEIVDWLHREGLPFDKDDVYHCLRHACADGKVALRRTGEGRTRLEYATPNIGSRV